MVHLLPLIQSLVSLSLPLIHLSTGTRGLFRCLFFPAQTIFFGYVFSPLSGCRSAQTQPQGFRKGQGGGGSWWERKRKKRTKGKVKPVSQSPFCSAVSGEETSARLTLSHKHTHTQSNTHLASPRGRVLPHRCPELLK